MSEIQNKVVIITGASSGLGEATARRLAASALPVNHSTGTQSNLDSLGNPQYSCCESSDCLDLE